MEPRLESGLPAATIATSVYERLRLDIVAGNRVPGEKLRIEALQEKYAVSAGPIREALNRLATEGFAVLQDQKGFRVTPVSVEDFVDLSRARQWIHEAALRESIRNGDAAWEERVLIAFHRLSKAAAADKRAGDPATHAELSRCHKEFHLSLISACGSMVLLGIVSSLNDNVQRYLNLAGIKEHDPMRERGGHRQIMDAALSRDEDLAIRLHHQHSLRTAEVIAGVNSRNARSARPGRSAKARKASVTA